VKEKEMSAQAQEPPITIIEPENLETIFITGGLVEAIDPAHPRLGASDGKRCRWAPINPAAAPNTYTRKGGSKRD
jgi:hypothetical protein